MKLDVLQKLMCKPVFVLSEVKRLAWETSENTVRLQLHQWVRAGHLIRLKRGVYAWPGQVNNRADVAAILYGPCYLSLQSALHHYGLMPDVVFALTLLTTRTTRKFNTPLGQFAYHHIKADLFWGYDPDTLCAHPEKAVVDYCYLYSARLVPDPVFWQEERWQNLDQIHFKKAIQYARKTGVKKVVTLLESLEDYGKAQKNHF